jgi:hypothetical protein
MSEVTWDTYYGTARYTDEARPGSPPPPETRPHYELWAFALAIFVPGIVVGVLVHSLIWGLLAAAYGALVGGVAIGVVGYFIFGRRRSTSPAAEQTEPSSTLEGAD